MQETLSVSGALLVKTFGRQDEEVDDVRRDGGPIRYAQLAPRHDRPLVRHGDGSVRLRCARVVVYWYGGHRSSAARPRSVRLSPWPACCRASSGQPHRWSASTSPSSARSRCSSASSTTWTSTRRLRTARRRSSLPTRDGSMRSSKSSFAYVPERQTSCTMSFTCRPGQFAALVGPPAPARQRSPTWCPASTTSTAAGY